MKDPTVKDELDQLAEGQLFMNETVAKDSREHPENREQDELQMAEYFSDRQADLNRKAYRSYRTILKNIGITGKIVDDYRIGIDAVPRWDPDPAVNGVTYSFIIPMSAVSYLSINIDSGYWQHVTGEDYQSAIFNDQVLQDPEADSVYIVADAFSAMILTDKGYPTMAIPEGKAERVADRLQNVKKKLIILSGSSYRFDVSSQVNEWNAGNAIVLKTALKHKGITAEVRKLTGYASAADLIKENPSLLDAELRPEGSGTLMTAAEFIQERLTDEIIADTSINCGTGFWYYDRIQGDIRPSLTIIGGRSGIGKTTWLLQVLDHLAESGVPCILFELEMSQQELIYKSVSRLCAIHGQWIHHDDVRRIIESQKRGIDLQPEDLQKKQMVNSMMKIYLEKIAPNMIIVDTPARNNNQAITASTIRQRAEEFIREHDGQRPVIGIDHLHLLTPDDQTADVDQFALSRNVKILANMAKQYHVPVFLLSQLNRQNYFEHISMEAFKGSGQVEATADNLIGLEPAVITEYEAPEKMTKEEELKKRKAVLDSMKENPIRLTVTIVKNRGSGTLHRDRNSSNLCDFFRFRFFPACDYFKEEE